MYKKSNVKIPLILSVVVAIGFVFIPPALVSADYLIAPSAYWRLEELGTPYQDAIGLIDATCANCPVSSNINPQVRNYQDFDGNAVSGDEVDVAASGNDPGDAVFDWGADDSFAVAFWMRTDYTDVLDINEVIVGRDDLSGTKMQWWVGLAGPDDAEQGKVVFQLLENGWTTAAGKLLKSDTAVTDGEWHHIVVVRDDVADQNLLYVDGELQGTPISPDYGTSGFNSVDRPMNIGYLKVGNNSPNYWYKGDVDEIAIYSDLLTAPEVLQQYANGSAGKWLDEVFGATIVSDPIEFTALGYTYMYDTEASSNPLATYSLTDEPDGMSIDGQSGEIEWLPNNLQVGDYTFTVTAQNSEGLGNQSVTLGVYDLCDPLDGDMAAYWRLEENGSPYDEYFGLTEATCTSCPTQDNSNAISGFYQDFDGSAVSGDEVDVAASGNDPGDAVFDWGADDSFAIEFWMRTDYTDVLDINEVIIGRDDLSGTKMQWWVGLTGPDDAEQGKVFFQLLENGFTTAAGKALKSDNAVTDGEWHHIVAVRDDVADQNLLYVDGKLQGTPISPDYGTSGFNSVNRPMNIGYLKAGNNPPSYWYKGDVDEIAIYKTALASNIIEQHYSQMKSLGYCIDSPVIPKADDDNKGGGGGGGGSCFIDSLMQ